METIHVRNVNHALPIAMAMLANSGVSHDSRAGGTLRMPYPVATIYQEPMERVLFDPDRNCNPFFHFFETMWILEGRCDVKFLQFFNSRMNEFSDDGITYHGPYGHRLRSLRAPLGIDDEIDQIELAITMLYEDGNTRRCALQIWDGSVDLNSDSKDVPCNMMAALRINTTGALDITVFNRSNDILWGAYGTNVVQFSMLQEYIAARAGYPVGTYTQISNDFHVYTDLPFWVDYKKQYSNCRVRSTFDPYGDGTTTALLYDLLDIKMDQVPVVPYPLFEDPMFDVDLHAFFEAYDGCTSWPAEWHTHAFNAVVMPMYTAWSAYKVKRYDLVRRAIQNIYAVDWRMACELWFERAMRNKQEGA
jgi:hypothetical protein